MSAIGQNIKRIRKVKNLSQAKFAQLFHLARPSVGAYEEGRAEPKINTVIEIANYFGLSIDVLLTKELTVNDLYSFDLVNQKLDDFHEGITPKSTGRKRTSAQLVAASQQLEYVVNHRKRDFIEKLPAYDVPLSFSNKFRIFEMAGNHMETDRSGMLHGDLLFCENIPLKPDELPAVEVENVLLCVTTEGIKVYRLEATEKDRLGMTADNPNHRGVTLHTSDLLEVWVVRAVLSTHIPSPQKMEKKVLLLENHLKSLLERMDNMEKGKPQE